MKNFITLFGQPKKKFSPRQLSGLTVWLRADLGVTLNVSAVSTWNDQSGNTNHVTQATSSKQPAFNASGSNGKPYIRSDGVDDVLRCTNNVWPAGDLTVFAVLASISGKSGEFFCDSGVGGDSRNHFYSAVATSLQRFNTGPTATLSAGTIALVVYTATGTGAGSSESMYLNNGTPATVTNSRPVLNQRGLDLFGVGATPLLACSYDLYEFGILNRVASSAELTKIYKYAKLRYGVA